MKWFKHLVFLVFFVIVFSFVEIHEKRREVLLEKNSKVSYVVAYPRILRTICLFLFVFVWGWCDSVFIPLDNEY